MKRHIKNIISAALLMFVSTALFSAAKKNNQKSSTDAEIEQRTLSNGIPVYFMENTVNKIDSIIVGIKGGNAYYTPEMSGIEFAALTMMGKGSASYNYGKLQSLKYQTSATVMANAGFYGGWLSLNTIDEYLDLTLPMLLDGIVRPEFDSSEFMKLKNEFSNNVSSTLNTPESLLSYLSGKILFEGHPYATSSNVTPDSINNITLEAVKTYYESMLDSRRFYVVAVTKKSPDELIQTLEDYLGSIPAGTEPLKTVDLPEIATNHAPLVFSHQYCEGTSHITRTIKAPSTKSDEYMPFIISENIYSQILYNVVRAKYGSCYSIWANDIGKEANLVTETVYNCSDFTNIKAQLAEARQIMAEGKYITGTKEDGSFVLADIKNDVEGFINSVITSLYASDATTAARASAINSGILIFNDVYGVKKMRSKLNSITYQQIQDVFNKYILSEDECWFAITGPGEEEACFEALQK